MKKFSLILISLLSATFFGTVFASTSTNAVEAGNGPTMQVTPVIEELSLTPATQEEKHITVTNQGNQDLKIRIYFAPYSVSEKTSDYESQSEYTQIYHWLKVKDDSANYKDTAEFTIKPNSAQNIYYRIDVPESAPGGSQHACLFVETVPEETEPSSITTVSRTAVKIFADVSGETVKDVEVINLDTNTLVVDRKVSAIATVKNIGNVDIKPTLTLKITALNGDTLFTDTDVVMIFPDDSDELIVEWPETPAFGIYKLITSVNILGKNRIIEKTIFILPSWSVLLFSIAIIVAVTMICRSRKIRNSRKARTPSETINS